MQRRCLPPAGPVGYDKRMANLPHLTPLMQHTHSLTQALVGALVPKKDIKVDATISAETNPAGGVHLRLAHSARDDEMLYMKVAQCLILDEKVQKLMQHAAIHIGSRKTPCPDGVLLSREKRGPTLGMEHEYKGSWRMGAMEPLESEADGISGRNEFEREDNLVAHYRRYERAATKLIEQATAKGFDLNHYAPLKGMALDF